MNYDRLEVEFHKYPYLGFSKKKKNELVNFFS